MSPVKKLFFKSRAEAETFNVLFYRYGSLLLFKFWKIIYFNDKW